MKTKLLLILLIVWRLWLTTFTKHGDLHNGWNWAGVVAQRGVSGFFDLPRDVFWPQSRPNQPAGSIYLYTWSYWFNQTTDQTLKFINHRVRLFPSTVIWWWERYGDVVSLKLPSIAGDLALYLAIVRFAKIVGREKLGKKVGLVYLLNPPLWYNSSLWGQNDCIVAALAVWSLLLLWEKRLALSAVLLGVSLATKASWAPLGLLYAIYWWRKYPRQLAKILLVPFTAILLFLPFHPQIDLPLWLSQLYLQRILPGESAFATVNAFNLWQLVFGSQPVLDTMYNANFIGLAVVAGLAIWTAGRLWRRVTPENFIWQMTILYSGIFLFATRMHERYLYPIFPLLSLLLVTGWRLWWQYGLLSVTFIFNQYSWWWAPNLPWLVAWYTDSFTRGLSGVNLLTWGWLVKLKPRHE